MQKTAEGRRTCLLTPRKEREMCAITQTTLRPDVVMWSTTAKKVLIIELTVPWQKGMSAAYEFKRFKYSNLVADCREGGWTTTNHPVEVGCRGNPQPGFSMLGWDDGYIPEEVHQGAGCGG